MLPNPKMQPTVYVPQGTPVNIPAKIARAADATAVAPKTFVPRWLFASEYFDHSERVEK